MSDTISASSLSSIFFMPRPRSTSVQPKSPLLIAPSAVKWPFLMWYFSANSVRPGHDFVALCEVDAEGSSAFAEISHFHAGSQPFSGSSASRDVSFRRWLGGRGLWGSSLSADIQPRGQRDAAGRRDREQSENSSGSAHCAPRCGKTTAGDSTLARRVVDSAFF